MTHDLRKSTDSAPCTRGRGSPTVKDGGAAWQCSDREHHGRVAHFKFPFSFGIFFSPTLPTPFPQSLQLSPYPPHPSALSSSPLPRSVSSSPCSLFLTAPSLCLPGSSSHGPSSSVHILQEPSGSNLSISQPWPQPGSSVALLTSMPAGTMRASPVPQPAQDQALLAPQPTLTNPPTHPHHPSDILKGQLHGKQYGN